MIAKTFDTVTAVLFGGNIRSADVATGAYTGLGVGLLIGYIALREHGSVAPIFAGMVDWLLPVALFMGLLAQRRRIALFGRIGREEDADQFGDGIDSDGDIRLGGSDHDDPN